MNSDNGYKHAHAIHTAFTVNKPWPTYSTTSSQHQYNVGGSANVISIDKTLLARISHDKVPGADKENAAVETMAQR